MKTIPRLAAAALCLCLAHGAAWSQFGEFSDKPSVGQAGKDVVWVPTSEPLVNRMLDMAKLTPEDRLVDLGSGDGRMVITAAKRGATARGIEFNGELVALSRRTAKAEGVTSRATFERADIFKSDFSEATVVTLFLLPSLNLRLRPTLLDMPPGTRIVSNSFDMGDWEPDETDQNVAGCWGHCTAHLWIVPARVGGIWAMGDRVIVLSQAYQKVEGVMREGDQNKPVYDGRLHGTAITFSFGGERYDGHVNGREMHGTSEKGTPWSATFVKP